VTDVLFFGFIIEVMMIIGADETDPGPQIEEKVKTLIGHSKTRRETGKKGRELLENNKSSSKIFQNTVKRNWHQNGPDQSNSQNNGGTGKD
jgi:hypothetical protein